MDIRLLRPSDIPHVQLANITNLPENYFCKYYLYHAMSWPQLSYVAVDVSLFSLSLEDLRAAMRGCEELKRQELEENRKITRAGMTSGVDEVLEDEIRRRERSCFDQHHTSKFSLHLSRSPSSLDIAITRQCSG